MKIRWTKAASQDLDSIHDYISRDNPKAAVDQVMRVIHVIEEHLADNPWMGRAGRLSNTREFAVPGTPYITIYQVTNDVLEILRVLHGAQQWPPIS